MCGIKSKVLLCGLVLALSLLPVSLSADVYYRITEEELIELETILTTQGEAINQLENTLTMQRDTLTLLTDSLQTATDTLQMQETTISALETSLTQYESEVRVKLWTTSAISFGIGIGIGAVIIAIFTN